MSPKPYWSEARGDPVPTAGQCTRCPHISLAALGQRRRHPDISTMVRGVTEEMSQHPHGVLGWYMRCPSILMMVTRCPEHPPDCAWVTHVMS